MLLNYRRYSFWMVLVPLLLAAGFFWMGELRGYRSDVALLALPKQELALGAAGNLTAIAQELSFAAAVYEGVGPEMKNSFFGKTPVERQATWKRQAEIRLVPASDLIRISASGDTQEDAHQFAQAITLELARTASHYYNQKTDLDLRVVTEAVSIPKTTAWNRYVLLVGATALGFTGLFFAVYVLIGWMFPIGRSRESQNEYVISAETFRPRPPKYWDHDESTSPQEVEPFDETRKALNETDPSMEFTEESTAATGFVEPVVTPEVEDTLPDWEIDNEHPVHLEALADEKTETLESLPRSTETESLSLAPETSEPVETDAYTGYSVEAAAPDNLPIVDGPISPLQGAQARLLKQDIDATAEHYASLHQPQSSEEPSRPQTHEPSADEYRRRLNELLSGKM